MAKFKIGQRVKLTATGDVGTVTRLEGRHGKQPPSVQIQFSEFRTHYTTNAGHTLELGGCWADVSEVEHA